MSALVVDLVPLLNDNYGYLLTDAASGAVGFVDPGEAAPVLVALQSRGADLAWILITHHHGDHTGGVAEIVAATGARVVGPAAEAARIPGLDLEVGEGDRIALGSSEATVIATPGHTRGHIAFHFAGADALFCGDTLFVMGCGRVIEGDAATMWGSLSRLAALPDVTRIYCGHEYTVANARFARTVDPDNAALAERAREVEALRAQGRPTIPSTLAQERATNPFLRAADPAIRRQLGLADTPDAEVFAELRRRKNKA